MPNKDIAGIIPFDAGLIMSTETEWVFLEHMKLHPGAMSVWKNWNTQPCPCGHSRCEMLSFQDQMRGLFHEDSNKLAEFFNKCLVFQGDTPSDYQLEPILIELLGPAPKRERSDAPGGFIQRLLESIPGVKVIKIDFPPQE